MKKDLSFEERVRFFKERVNRLKEKLGPEFVPYTERWEKEKEKIIEEFIEGVIKRFESFAEAFTVHPPIMGFPLDSLSLLFRDEVEDVFKRLEKLGFTVEYFGPAYLPCSNSFIQISLNREKSEAEASECSH